MPAINLVVPVLQQLMDYYMTPGVLICESGYGHFFSTYQLS